MTKVGRMTFSPEQIELQKHIEANFKGLVSDPLHWAKSDIFNIDQLGRYLDEEAYVCLHKSAYGFKPRQALSHLSDAELRAEIDRMSLVVEMEIADEKARHAAEKAAREDRLKPRYRCNQCHTPVNDGGVPLSEGEFKQAGGEQRYLNATPTQGKGCCLFGKRVH